MYPSYTGMTTNRFFKIFAPKLIAITTAFLVSAPNLVSVAEPSAQLISTQTQSGGSVPTDSGGFKPLQITSATTGTHPVTRVAEADRVILHWHGDLPHYQVAAAAAGETGAPVIAAQSIRPLNNTGERRALVINVARADGFAAPRDQVLKNYEEAAQWMHHVSRGQLTIKVEMFLRDVVVPLESNICTNFDEYGRHALEQVRREIGVDGYRFISFVLPQNLTERESVTTPPHDCLAAGLGEWGKNFTWNFADPGNGQIYAPQVRGIAHEWGHNVGLHHHNMLYCSEGGQDVAFLARAGRTSNPCIHDEYGASYSFMGSGTGASLTASERQLIGWLRPGEQTTVSDATITLHRDGPVSLAWVRNSEGDIFQLEFVNELLAPDGVQSYYQRNNCYTARRTWKCVSAPGTYSHAGVLVKFVQTVTWGVNRQGNYVLDMNPQTAWEQDSPLRAQQSWTDPTGSVTITVINVLGDSATVHIRGQAVLPEAVTTVTSKPLRNLGVVDVSWQKSASLFPVSYEVRIFEGAEQREIYIAGVNTVQARIQLPVAAWGRDYWISVRAVSEVGAGSPSALTPVRWKQTKKPCVGKKPRKRCK